MTDINNWPLSGPVAQSWGWWIRELSQQTGFININTVQSPDTALERRIIEEVASYGRQLGWITEALDVIADRFKTERPDLTHEERLALQQISDLVRSVEMLKGDSKTRRLTGGQIDRMLDDLRALRTKEPEAYEELAERIREEFLEPHDGTP